MKITRFIIVATITSLLTSCGAPLVQNILSVPGKIVSGVASPLINTVR
ncbi:MAG: hypothetical protein ACSHX6_16855 [Akkermansiaceae bacterium]